MVNIERVRISLTGFPGGPGVATFYCLDAATALPELKGLMAGVAVYMPDDVAITYPTEGDTIDPVDGNLMGSWSAGGRAGDNGAVTGAYAAPVGACTDWRTGSILDGHRLIGRTFWVPLGASSYATDGSLDTGVLAGIQSISDAKVSSMSGNFVVWHRPKKDKITHAVTRAGGYTAVASAHVPDKAVVLRSRRA